MFTVLGTVSGVSSPLSCSCRVLLESTQLEGTVAGRGRASPLAPLRETWVQFPGWEVWEVPLEKEMQPTPVFLPGESLGQRSLAAYTVHGITRVRHDLELPFFLSGWL